MRSKAIDQSSLLVVPPEAPIAHCPALSVIEKGAQITRSPSGDPPEGSCLVGQENQRTIISFSKMVESLEL